LSWKQKLNQLKSIAPPKVYASLILSLKGLKQINIAAQIGVSQISVSRYLRQAKEIYLQLNEDIA
jgi:predicted transcriptional regulator